MNAVLLSAFLVGIVCIALGIPLALDKVPRNDFYGYRTTKSMSSPEIWSKANIYSGKAFVIAGIITVVISLLLTYASRSGLLGARSLMLACVFTQIVPLMVGIVFTAVYVRKL